MYYVINILFIIYFIIINIIRPPLTGMRSWMLENLAVASTVMMANVNRGCKSLYSKAETEGKIH